MQALGMTVRMTSLVDWEKFDEMIENVWDDMRRSAKEICRD